MSTVSPSTWIWLPKVARSPLGLSTHSFASLAFNESSSRRRAKRLVPRSSQESLSSPSSGEGADKKPSSEISFFEAAKKRVLADIRESDETGETRERNRANKGFFLGGESFFPLSRRPRCRLHFRSFRERQAWKGIFFASKKVRSIVLLNVLTVIYASDIPVLKEVEVVMEPAFFTMVRFVVSAIPFLPFVLHARRDCNTRSAGIELGFWVSLGYLSQALGLLTSDAGRASFISAFTVIVVPFIDGMFGATVPILTWSGALVSLIGVAILECSGSPPCVGDILNIFSAVFFGIHMLRTEQVSRTTEKEKVFSLLGYEICVIALSSTVWFLLKDIFGEVHQLRLESCTWSMLWDWMISFPWIPALYTGIFSTGFCLWAEMVAMSDVSATETAIIYGMEPVWGAAFAWFLLGERWGSSEWIGAALVLCGSLTVQILGSTPKGSKKVETSNNCNHLRTSDKQNGLFFSTVVVNSQPKRERP